MSKEVRLTFQTLRIFGELLPGRLLSGADISKATGIRSGSVYPTLTRLTSVGWLVGTWERVNPRAVGRPRRRLYRLTAVGKKNVRQALAALGVET